MYLIKIVFPVGISKEEETDDYYEFTAEDYYKLLATKKEGNIDYSNLN